MSRVKVTFFYTPDEDQADPDHPTGLTNEEFDKLSDELFGALGAEDIAAEKEDE